MHLWQDEDWSIRTEQEQFEPYRDKLPQLCFTLLPGTGQLICVKRGESGYYPSGWSTPDAQENRRIADEQNRKLGVTPAQEEIPAEPAEVYYLSQGESFQWYGETAWVSGYDTTVDLVIKGPRNELRKLDRSKIRIVANTSNIKEAGSQTLTYEVVFPDNIRRGKLTVDSASIYSITVTVGELDSKEVPIQCEIVGSVADGFMAGELTLDPEVLLLRGQRDDLLNVSYAKVRLDITGADKTVVQALEFELYDHNDVKIENSAIRSSEKLIGATMPVSTVKEVPLRVNFVEAVGATMETVDYTISPATVKLVGEKARLDEIDSIVLDTLYVQDLEDSQSLTYTIPVPEDVTIADGVDTATVTVVVRGVTERTLTVSRFTFENVPEGMTATAETESLNVRLRGLTAEVNALTAENVHIVADLSGLTGAGVHTVPVTIRIEGYENIGIKGSYQMVVDLSVTPDEPGQP